MIASDEAGLDATIIIKSKAGEYTTVENKRNIFSYDKELDVMPGDSVMCYIDYAVSSTFKYEIKADGKLVQTKSIAPMQAPMYTRKNILFGYLVAD
ncbi:hypothetical protein [Mucilaginibacter aquatilis]|uniref:Uncharacterized protein n=1 Tax=Mucilaginibacter aquatilis TaxID=1517760 RepID=A0A6I4I438_9SPHI|nr:hypothetical protein [Mucilaginibacter aquatilis]MVN89820.1 hypothetical protein [Mucilaginibacter aquatilis]